MSVLRGYRRGNTVGRFIYLLHDWKVSESDTSTPPTFAPTKFNVNLTDI